MDNDEIHQLEQAIATLETQRDALGDSVVETMLVPAREKLAILKRQSESDQQRKLVTFLFTDVVSSSKTFGHLDPEDTLEILSTALARFGKVVKQHQGYVARLMGDGMLAFFGAPIAHEDDAVQAVRSALAIIQAARQYAQEVAARWGIDSFNVRVGLNTGLVAVGEVGGEAGSEYTAMGDAINMAARMESNAPAGGVLISHETYLHVRGFFEVQALEPMMVKGALAPIQVYVVLREIARSFETGQRGIEGIQTRMIGRDVEILHLQKAYQLAIEDGEAQIITIRGDAGVGKSRLLREFGGWTTQQTNSVLRIKGRAFPSSEKQPYALIRDLLQFYFSIRDTDSAEQAREKMEAGIGSFWPSDEITDVTQGIGQMVGFAFANLKETPQQKSKDVPNYLTQLFERISSQQPTVIFLEDVHWADDISLDFVSQFAYTHLQLPLLILCLARPILYEKRPYWGEGQECHLLIDLRPLSTRDSRQLVTEILHKVESLPDTLRDLIVSNAEGNPFYLEELIQVMIADGIILPDAEHWSVALDKLAKMRVPPTLTGVLQARLDALTAEERALIQQASVIGTTFWDGALQTLRVTGQTIESAVSITDLTGALASLRQHGMIYSREKSSFAETQEYVFKHAILRDVTYESVLKKTRRSYHHQIAEWLINACGNRVAEYALLVAEHYRLAGEIISAINYLFEAGEHARKTVWLKPNEVIRFYQQALDLTTTQKVELALHLPEAEIKRLQLEIIRPLAGLYLISQKYDSADEILQLELGLAEELENYLVMSEAYSGLAVIAQEHHDKATAEHYHTLWLKTLGKLRQKPSQPEKAATSSYGHTLTNEAIRNLKQQFEHQPMQSESQH
ncbi:MAG: AAA family ATPase [Anaerolineae bacterium]|nr:AAA family ATPase [Anaerolineae bacterium]